MTTLLFLNVGWMARYAGANGDQIRGGGKYVALHGYGHELLNFKAYAGRIYGTAPVPQGVIKLERLGAPKKAQSISNVLVIWVAKSRIIGWYKNATVYRQHQSPPKHSGRFYKGHPVGYYVTASESNCKLLDPDARLVKVPRARERQHAMGRYIWYAEGQRNRAFRLKVLEYVALDGNASVSNKGKSTHQPSGGRHQPDPQKRVKVECAAVNMVTQHFELLGYMVDSVERDNLGWDLNAVHPQTNVRLRLEVKGLSGADAAAELTPNEFKMMKKHRSGYRICIATNCLDNHGKSLAVFAYNERSGQWSDGDDRSLTINEVKAARLSCG